MKKIAVFPGSFDPLTLGHEDIVLRAITFFDEVIVAIGNNSAKQSFFDLERRIFWIEQTFAGIERVKVDTYSGLTIDYCKKMNAGFMIRGLRNSTDFEFERGIAQMNKKMHQNIETVFLMTLPEYSAITSSIVREILRHGGNTSEFVPKAIQSDF